MSTDTMRHWLRNILIALGALILLTFVGVKVTQRLADGPMGPLQGGPLTTGELVSAPVPDWSFADGEEAEIELVGFHSSRITGLMVHDGELYIPCDLGFMWGRFEGQTRLILHTLYIFKTWHQDALEDGRLVVRINGKRYLGQAERVTDPTLTADLRSQLEDMAREWVAPAELGPPPTEGPRDIWFFRVDPRAA